MADAKMSKKEGKKTLLAIAEELIMQKGYDEISVREIAREANLSVGTLYHHFPLGKLSILNEIIKSHGETFFKNFDYEKIKDEPTRSLTKKYLFTLIERARHFAPIIKGVNIELLTNEKIVKDLHELMKKEEEQHFKTYKNIILSFYPNMDNYEKTAAKVSRIINSIINSHVIVDDLFGKDEELVEILYQMLKGVLKIEE